MEERCSTLNLSIFLSTIGIFIPVIIQIIYSKFNYFDLDEDLIVLRYLFFPAVCFVSSAVIYFKKINSKTINFLIMLNALFIGLLIYLFSIADKLDLISQAFQSFFIIPLSIILLFATFLILPLAILVVSLFYNSFIKIFGQNKSLKQIQNNYR